MSTVGSLSGRNLKLFFRDRASVFFSLLSVIIIIALYALFLGNIQIQELENAAQGHDIPDAGWLVNSWILAGILAVSTVTVSLGAYGTMVDDVHGGQIKDFFVSPIKRAQLVAGYMVSSALISFIMNLVGFVIAEAYIALSGGKLLSPLQMLETLGILCLSIFAFSSLVCFMTSYVKSPRAFGTLSTIVGTMIGFLTGIYVPVGILPSAVVTVMKFIPFTYSALWLRQVFTAAPMQQVFAHAPEQAVRSYADAYGINLYFGDTAVTPWMMALIIAGTGALFFLLSIWRLSKRTWITK
jgi:multidrug/hemolysin transport system permease protein